MQKLVLKSQRLAPWLSLQEATLQPAPTSSYVKPKKSIGEADVMSLLRDAYAGERFVRVVDHLPGTKDTVDTNFCDITARGVRGRILLISCLDNLVKGAAGAAVQNFNVLYGLPETTGLL